jgi:TrmH family RNA methyltransferase
MIRPSSVQIITSASNSQVKFLTGLRSRDRREDAELFLAEGLRMASHALDCGFTPRILAYDVAAKTDAAVQKLVRACLAAGGECLELNESLLGKITRRDNPQPVIAAYVPLTKPLSAIDPAKTPVILGLDRIKDPGNLGTIIRTADAAGAAILLIGESCDPHGTESVRASAGSIFSVEMFQGSEDEVLNLCNGWTGDVLGAVVGASEDYRTVKPALPSLLLLGNEQYGLSPPLIHACTKAVHVPMLDRVESLNVGIAAGILLFGLFPPKI